MRRSLNSAVRAASIVALFLAVQGCISVPKGAVLFKPNPSPVAVKRSPLRIAVAPFEAIRPDDESVTKKAANLMVPLYLFTQSSYYFDPYFYEYGTPDPPRVNTPRASRLGFYYNLHNGKKKTLEACVAEDLKASGLFKSVQGRAWEQLAEDHTDVDLVVTGFLRYDRVKTTNFQCYGLGFVGWALTGLLPLPVASMQRSLRIEFLVHDARSPSVPLWSTTVDVDGDMDMAFSGMGLMIKTDLVEMLRECGNFSANFATPKLYQKALAKFRERLVEQLQPKGKLMLAQR